MNISIPKNISYRTYKSISGNLRSYIVDEIMHCQHILEDEASEIWELIASGDKKAFDSYVLNNSLNDEIDDFIIELKSKNLLNDSNSGNSIAEKSSVCINALPSENSDVVDYERKQWLFENGYLACLDLQLTLNCNQKCIHCYNDKTQNDKKISFEKAKSAIDQAYSAGIFEVSVTGGECTLNENFLEIVKYIRSKHLSFSVLTNGLNFYDNENLFFEFVNLCPHTVSLSLYSMTPEIHDEITRVKGSFEKTFNIIKKLKEHNVGLIINTPIFKTNLTSAKDVISFAKENNIPVSTGAYFVENSDNCNSSLKLDYDEILSLYSDSSSELCVTKKRFRSENKREQLICTAGTYQLSVVPNLDITPCHDLKYKFGNLFSDQLEDIWKNKASEFRENYKYKNLKGCLRENYCDYCIYCPIEAGFQQKFMERSYNLCEHAKAYREAENILKKGK